MNIQKTCACLAVMMLVFARAVQATEAHVVVKIQDSSKEITTSVMSVPEFKALEKTIQLETQYFPQAIAAAAKEWRENEANKGIPFAGSRVVPRKIVGTPERFTSKEKADAKLMQIEDMESKKADRLAEREFAKKKALKKSKEELAREFKKESELAAAQEAVQAKLAEIIAAKSGGAPAPDAKGGQPDAAAKEAGKKAL